MYTQLTHKCLKSPWRGMSAQQFGKSLALLILSLQRKTFLIVSKSRSMNQCLLTRLLTFVEIGDGRNKEKILSRVISFPLLVSCIWNYCSYVIPYRGSKSFHNKIQFSRRPWGYQLVSPLSKTCLKFQYILRRLV